MSVFNRRWRAVERTNSVLGTYFVLQSWDWYAPWWSLEHLEGKIVFSTLEEVSEAKIRISKLQKSDGTVYPL